MLVRHGTTTLVVDAGPDFRAQCLRAGVSTLDAILLTHAHADHMFGLDDARAFSYRSDQALPLVVPTHAERRIRSVFAYAFEEPQEGRLCPRFDMRVQANGDSFALADLHVTLVPVDHGGDRITGYRFEHAGRSVLYLTDCKSVPAETLAAARAADAVVLTALWDRNWEHHAHCNLQEALQLAAEIKAPATYLTHCTHLIGRHQNLSAKLPPGVHLAYDGLQIDLTPSPPPQPGP